MMNRAQRRALKGKAGAVAALLASWCFDFAGTSLAPVHQPQAIAALRRAFTLLLRSGGQPLAVPLSPAEAASCPDAAARGATEGVTWLAVGLDADRRASYVLQTAKADDRALAHEAARSMALSRLAEVAATSGFPVGTPRGRA